MKKTKSTLNKTQKMLIKNIKNGAFKDAKVILEIANTKTNKYQIYWHFMNAINGIDKDYCYLIMSNIYYNGLVDTYLQMDIDNKLLFCKENKMNIEQSVNKHKKTDNLNCSVYKNWCKKKNVKP